MLMPLSTYVQIDSPVHRLDARVKIVLLLAYSIMLFMVDAWLGMAVAFLGFALSIAASRLSAARVMGMVAPVYVLAGFAVLFNSFAFIDPAAASDFAVGVSGAFSGVHPLIGTFSFVEGGCERGAFYALRVMLLVYASIVVTLSTTSTELTRALGWFLSPLRCIRVPVDDIAMVFSIALRFIPVTAEEFSRVRNAQWSRGSRFGEGSFVDRLRAWQTVMIPMFVGLFRRADSLARAMDARCYGASTHRASLHSAKMGASSVCILLCGLAVCVSCSLFM